MPTLTSIQVHPRLIKKLKEEVDPPIRSPLAILSRDPSTQILEGVPLHLWDNVRSNVANALLKSSSSSAAATPNTITSESSFIPGSFTALEYQRHLNSICSKHHPLRTNCGPIDGWCQPAEGAPMLIQFTGPHGSGKTQACLSLAINHIRLEHESASGRVYYILSSNNSPNPIARRLRQLSLGKTKDLRQVQMMLDRIELTSVGTPYQVLYTLQQLIEDKKEDNNDGPILLVFDSVSGCLSGCTDWNLIQQIGIKLKELVAWHGVQVVLTNGVVSNDKAALGQIWSDVADVIIRMDIQISNKSNEIDEENYWDDKVLRAVLERHPVQTQHTNHVEYLLTAQGLETCQNLSNSTTTR